ncbi:MAG: hypothetical protein ACXVY5_04405, partial [Gaiellales bacterium]
DKSIAAAAYSVLGYLAGSLGYVAIPVIVVLAAAPTRLSSRIRLERDAGTGEEWACCWGLWLELSAGELSQCQLAVCASANWPTPETARKPPPSGCHGETAKCHADLRGAMQAPLPPRCNDAGVRPALRAAGRHQPRAPDNC